MAITSMASSVPAAAAEPDAAVAKPAASSSASAASVSPAQSRAEKAAALRAKILAKQGQRMAIVAGYADAATAAKHSAGVAASSEAATLSPSAPTAAAAAVDSPSPLASALQPADSSHAEPVAVVLHSAASSPPPPPLSWSSTATAVSSPASAASDLSAVVLTRGLSATLGLVAAVFPSLLSFSLFLCLLIVLQASLYCLRLSSSTGSSGSAAPPAETADDRRIKAAVSRLLPASLSSAFSAANGLASVLQWCTQLLDGCCLFVAVQATAQAASLYHHRMYHTHSAA